MDDKRIREIATECVHDIFQPNSGQPLKHIETAIRAALAESWGEEPSQSMWEAAKEQMPNGHANIDEIFRAMAAVRAREFQPPESGE